MIPKIAHFYWGNPILPYLRFLTLQSFIKYNPDWQVILWRPEVVAHNTPWSTHEQKYEVRAVDYTDRLADIKGLEVRVIPSNEFCLSGVQNDVHRSDIWRLHLLSTMGGIWADMDIVFFAGVPNALLYVDNIMCKSPIYQHSIGFLGAKQGSRVFDYLLRQATTNTGQMNYQMYGAVLYNREDAKLQMFHESILNLPMPVVYAYDATMIPSIYQDTPPSRFTSDSIGLHWYAGHQLAGAALNAITKRSDANNFTHLLATTIRKAMPDADF